MCRYSRPVRGRKHQGGFTLVEIMLVVVILLTLAAVVVPKLSGRARQAKIGATKASIASIKTSLGQYEVSVGDFPTTEQGLEALVSRPSDVPEDAWGDKYLETLPKDSWGREFKYACPSNHGMDFDLVSAGPDGKFDTKDDITNYADTEDKSGSSI